MKNGWTIKIEVKLKNVRDLYFVKFRSNIKPTKIIDFSVQKCIC